MELHNEFRVIAMQRAIEELPADLVLAAFREVVWQFYYQEASFKCLNGTECQIDPQGYADKMAQEIVSKIQCFPTESIRKKAIKCMVETEKNRIILRKELAKKLGIEA